MLYHYSMICWLYTYRQPSVTYLSNVASGSDSQSSYYVFADNSLTILIG